MLIQAFWPGYINRELRGLPVLEMELDICISSKKLFNHQGALKTVCFYGELKRVKEGEEEDASLFSLSSLGDVALLQNKTSTSISSFLSCRLVVQPTIEQSNRQFLDDQTFAEEAIHYSKIIGAF